MAENRLRVHKEMFERYKTFCVLYGCSNASAIDCTHVWGIRIVDFRARDNRMMATQCADYRVCNVNFHARHARITLHRLQTSVGSLILALTTQVIIRVRATLVRKHLSVIRFLNVYFCKRITLTPLICFY